jgi:Mitochondrial ATP synthase B chain precursor (ATP-synt_B)
MKDVIFLTKALFSLSKVPCQSTNQQSTDIDAPSQDTAHLESSALHLQQKSALAAELHAVLDRWVRFKHQAKENEHAALACAVINRVPAGLVDKKVQHEIVNSAVTEVERMLFYFD